MAVVCDTSSVPVADRAELWVTASSKFFVPLECAPHDRTSFHGVLQAGAVGPLALSRLDVAAHTIRRTRSLAAQTNGDRYKLSLLLGGQALVVQDGREAALRPGDFALYDCSRPYTIESRAGFRMLVCMLPRTVLGLEPERVARMTATRIAGDDGIAWALAPFLERLADLAIRAELPQAHHGVVESVVDLVESLCTSAIGGVTAHPFPSRAELLLRARAYAQAHLADPSLAPGDVAAAVHVSKRYLHKLFEGDDSTVSGWIRQRRLDGCSRDLADSACRNETVGSIGMRWGLTNPAHLSRLFREAYGVSPSEFRAGRLNPDDGT
jgi:AraC-like DNA-binding protein